MMPDTIDLASLSRADLTQLRADLDDEIARREHEERAALEIKIRSLFEDAGFDPNDVSFGKRRKRAGARKNRKNGDAND